MKYVPVLSRRTMFFCIISLSIVYIFYAFNACLVDENKVTLKYVLIRQQITKYKSASLRIASILGLNVNYSNNEYSNNNYSGQKQPRPVRRLPDALIIGVKKCGTRALLEFLSARMPPTLAGQLTIEKSPGYWAARAAPRRLRGLGPRLRLLAVVRDPVTRAISDYTQAASKHPSLPEFSQLALLNRSLAGGPAWAGVGPAWAGVGPAWAGVDGAWAAVRLGVYARVLRRWLRHFPRRRLLLVSGERLVAAPAAEMARVQEFLGLKRFITEKHFYLNSSKGFPCVVKGQTPHCLGRGKGRRHPRVDNDTLRRLRAFYRPHNRHFYQLAGTDFGWP